MCTFRFKRRLRRRRDGNSYSGRRWSNGGWRRFWSFSSSWTSWVKTTSDRSWNEPMPPVGLCSPRLTSLPWMSSTSSSGLRGTTTWGVLVSNVASDHQLFVPTWAFTCDSQVDRPIQSGIATLVGAAGRPGQGRGGNNLWDSLTLVVLVSVGLLLTWDFLLFFGSRQDPEGHSAQSAVQRLLWQSADPSEWNVPGGRGAGWATCCGWVPGWGTAIGTWYRLHLHLCFCEILLYTRQKKLFYYSMSSLKKDQLVKSTQSLFKWKPQRLVGQHAAL